MTAMLGSAVAGSWTTVAAVGPGSDPAIGPHKRDEARHQGDVLNFRPARTAPRPLQRSGSSPTPAVGAQLAAGPLNVVPAPLRTDGPVAALPAASTTSTGRLQREVFGFAPYWALPNNASWNYQLLSTLAYFGLDMNGDGSFDTTTRGWNGWASQDLVDMVNRAHQVGDRVVVVIKAFDEATINQIVTTPASTQAAIDNTINAISSKTLDGVNVDFEGYASTSYPNIQSGFTNFMSLLSTKVHQRWPTAMVSADTYTGAASWDSGIFNIGALAPVVDAFFVMAYDMNFSNLPGHAGPNAPLTGWTYNDTTAVEQYLGKAPASKIILGVPYYGYKYSTSSNQPYAATTGGATADTYAGVLADFGCAQQLTHHWDDTAQSPWASWYSPGSGDPCQANYGSWRELYYDNPQSLGLKYDLVNSKNLRGTGIWALGYDGSSMDLWNELSMKFLSHWVRLGGSLSSSPAVASWGLGRLDLFARGMDSALYHMWFDGSWHPWEFLGGSLSSDPAAVSWGANRIDVFARGNDLALYQMWFDGTTWHFWTKLGGSLNSAPAVSSWGPNRLDVFAQGMDASLYQMSFDGTSWNTWQKLGGALTSNPAAVSWASERIDVFARGNDLALYHMVFDGSWHAWQSLGGRLASSPAASTWGPGRLDVFASGSDQALYHTWLDAGGWQPWQLLGGSLTSAPAAVSQGQGRIEVFARSGDQAVYQMSLVIF